MTTDPPLNPAPPARVDPNVAAALRAGPWVRALVTVRRSDVTPKPDSGTAEPLAAIKTALLNEQGGTVHLVKDYDQSPLLLVEIQNPEALQHLATLPTVEAIDLERAKTPN